MKVEKVENRISLIQQKKVDFVGLAASVNKKVLTQKDKAELAYFFETLANNKSFGYAAHVALNKAKTQTIVDEN